MTATVAFPGGMRVALVSHSARLGGAELCLVELAEGLVRLRGATAEVVLPAVGPLAGMLAAAGARPRVVRHYGWATANVPRPAAMLLAVPNALAIARLARWLRRERPDVVATNSITNPAGAYAARLARVPHLWLVNEYGDLDHGYRFALGVHRTMREVGRLSARVVTCSRALAWRIGEYVDPAKIEVAYYPVTLGLDRPRVPAPGAPGAPAMLILGRKHPGKGQADAVRAVALLRERGCAASLRVVGETQGSYGRYLAGLCASLGLGEEVVLVPRVEDPIAEIDACDVLVLCSRCEAFGRVVVEAMKRGRPVIATRAGGAQELVADSGGGLLYAPGAVSELADAAERLGRDPGEARRLGEKGRAWAEQHCTLAGYADAFLAAARRARA
ncbi:MAG TPA: glycosyltransferase family 4 protein [Thermoanaerobaculaceae bacterium]|nr:glycosyltransferase family 4 protein [Thermoanaerobaculaceae bacterium]